VKVVDPTNALRLSFSAGVSTRDRLLAVLDVRFDRSARLCRAMPFDHVRAAIRPLMAPFWMGETEKRVT
jgi:hypothetical protein